LVIISVGFDVTDQLILFLTSDTGGKWEYSEKEHWLLIDFKNAHDSVRREVLYTILLERGIPRK
jgi:hypothetical protein